MKQVDDCVARLQNRAEKVKSYSDSKIAAKEVTYCCTFSYFSCLTVSFAELPSYGRNETRESGGN